MGGLTHPVTRGCVHGWVGGCAPHVVPSFAGGWSVVGLLVLRSTGPLDFFLKNKPEIELTETETVQLPADTKREQKTFLPHRPVRKACPSPGATCTIYPLNRMAFITPGTKNALKALKVPFHPVVCARMCM